MDTSLRANALDDPAIARLLTIMGINLTVAAGIVAAIGGRAIDEQRMPANLLDQPRQLTGHSGKGAGNSTKQRHLPV